MSAPAPKRGRKKTADLGINPRRQTFITVIKFPSNLWLVDISKLVPPERGKRRRISAGPLLDLGALQAAIASGQLNAGGVWPATRRCRNSLEDCQWTFDDILHMLTRLVTSDFKNSEWCDIDGGKTVPCDAYTICYDETRRERNPRGIEVYLKFSVDGDTGTVTLVLVQAHLSR